jgi:aspartyl-tRNA(Asn)/glutamyl-tRNA(Gln) amidotransferase subunit B
MEEGSLRCDANVSVRAHGAATLGVRVEIKNLNSFRFLQRAIEHEVRRQTAVLEQGDAVVAETRLWDPAADRTVPMRSKEGADDYRYFPEPDLPPLVVTGERVTELRALLPELPGDRRSRLRRRYGLNEDVAALLADSRSLADFYELVAAESGDARAAAEWMRGELLRRLSEAGTGLEALKFDARAFGRLVRLATTGTLSAQAAKKVFGQMFVGGESPDDIVARDGLAQVSDRETIAHLVRSTLATHAVPVAQYRAGKRAALGFLVGAVMKASGGRANPQMVEAILKAELDDHSGP